MPDRHMQKPFFTSQISIGNVIQVGAFIVAMAWGWSALNERGQAMQSSITAEVSRGMERDIRIRGLEVKAERADERYNSIMALLHRIDKSIERMGKRD